MKYRTYLWIATKLITVFVLTGLVIFETNLVQSIQGNGRVINYSGIVRGATQRLIKLELTGTKDDALILRLDTVLRELNGNEGSLELTLLNDKEYSQLLHQQQAMWGEVKATIYRVRAGEEPQQLLKISEEYFTLCDAVTSAAEKYTDRVSKDLDQVQQLNIICIILLLADLIYQTMRAFNLSSIAFTDKQTGLANRLSCEIKLDQYSSRKGRRNICCMMLDLNNLKVVNDTLGHSYGDRLIMEFGQALQKSLPKDAFVGRFGGDEFIAVLEGKTEEDMKRIIEKIEQNVTAYNNQNEDCKISYSYGYELDTQADMKNIRWQLDKADEKMYIYKRNYKLSQQQA